MSRVLRLRNYGVYVGDERGAQHHGAHCHVKDRGRQIASLHLVTLEPFSQSEPLPDDLMELIRQRLDDLIAEWERLNS